MSLFGDKGFGNGTSGNNRPMGNRPMGPGQQSRPMNGPGQGRPMGPGQQSRPMNGPGQQSRPMNGPGQQSRPMNGPGQSRPMNGPGQGRPMGPGQQSRPMNGLGQQSRPMNGPGQSRPMGPNVNKQGAGGILGAVGSVLNSLLEDDNNAYRQYPNGGNYGYGNAGYPNNGYNNGYGNMNHQGNAYGQMPQTPADRFRTQNQGGEPDGNTMETNGNAEDYSMAEGYPAFCPGCGAPTSGGRFCEYCGSKVY